MPRLVKDPVRHEIVKAMPPALPGMKKRWQEDSRTVTYVPKTTAELARQAIKPPPTPKQTR